MESSKQESSSMHVKNVITIEKFAIFKNCIELQHLLTTQNRILKEDPLLKPFVTVQEIRFA